MSVLSQTNINVYAGVEGSGATRKSKDGVRRIPNPEERGCKARVQRFINALGGLTRDDVTVALAWRLLILWFLQIRPPAAAPRRKIGQVAACPSPSPNRPPAVEMHLQTALTSAGHFQITCQHFDFFFYYFFREIYRCYSILFYRFQSILFKNKLNLKYKLIKYQIWNFEYQQLNFCHLH